MSIDNGIGNVGLTGTRIIAPNETTTYTLIAVNTTTSLSASTQIIVTEPSEPLEPPETASITMNIYEKDSNTGTIIWLVFGIEGEPIEDDSFIAVLIKADSTGFSK